MKEIISCSNCGKEFNKNSTVAVLERFGNTLRFCSIECADEFVKGKKEVKR